MKLGTLQFLDYAALPVVNTTCFKYLLTFIAWSTVTPVVIYLIPTRAIILTGSGGTLVDVQMTAGALKSWHTETLVCIHSIFTDGSILAGLRLALVYVLLTVCPLVSCSTLAQVPSVRDVHTGATVLACFL